MAACKVKKRKGERRNSFRARQMRRGARKEGQTDIKTPRPQASKKRSAAKVTSLSSRRGPEDSLRRRCTCLLLLLNVFSFLDGQTRQPVQQLIQADIREIRIILLTLPCHRCCPRSTGAPKLLARVAHFGDVCDWRSVVWVSVEVDFPSHFRVLFQIPLELLHVLHVPCPLCLPDALLLVLWKFSENPLPRALPGSGGESLLHKNNIDQLTESLTLCDICVDPAHVEGTQIKSLTSVAGFQKPSEVGTDCEPLVILAEIRNPRDLHISQAKLGPVDSVSGHGRRWTDNGHGDGARREPVHHQSRTISHVDVLSVSHH
mmetsp:Transcript_2168/g.4573  ORF Transcript_2168/g.4573 Transcript_2168/m.4573 type:complete len:317 (-) Transcript_2168:1303-2253(-)